MSNLIIIGTQWGDEGKGKIVDLFAREADAVVRFQGGNNAGHTIIVNNEKTVLHLIPSGVLHKKCLCLLGNGMVIDPFVLLKEIQQLQARGFLADPEQLKVSDRAHLIMPYHCDLDAWREEASGANKIGTTKRGIGPCYEDKVGRRGIRAGDLLYPEQLKTSLKERVDYYNSLYTPYYKKAAYDVTKLYDEIMSVAEKLQPHIANTTILIHDLIKKNKRVLFEGAQGISLDIDHGTYPFVTSSNIVSGSVCAGIGIGPEPLNQIFGITKAYCTRVGAGPFPTELHDEVGTFLQERGHEFGATTGRKRRCGYLDLVALQHAVMTNSLTGLIITKLDVLTGLSEIKVCTQYKYQNSLLTHTPSHTHVLDACQPVYQSFSGWEENISCCQCWDDLPKSCQTYLNYLQDFLNVPIVLISKGPERDENIFVSPENNFWI